MNVYVSNISVPRKARNKRIYTGNFSSQRSTSTPTSIAGKAIVEFTDTDTPQIIDYSLYAEMYGQYPTVTLTVYDTSGNRVERSEKPYFVMAGGLIDSITFGTLDGIYTGFITINR